MILVRCIAALLRFISKWSAAIVVTGGLSFLVILIHRKVYDHLLFDRQYQINPRKIVMLRKPDWAGDGIERTLRGAFPYREPVSIFESGLPENVGRIYAGNPWVARVRYVRKVFPNKLQVAVDLRRPMAAIEHRSRFYLVDREGVRLPGEYAEIPDLPFRIPPLLGVRTPPPRAGTVWEGDDIQAGVALAATFGEHRVYDLLPIMAIDVQNVGGRRDARESEVLVWAADMIPIEWGRSPAGEPFGELPVEKKLKNLRLVLMATQGLKGVSRVRVQNDHPTYLPAR